MVLVVIFFLKKSGQKPRVRIIHGRALYTKYGNAEKGIADNEIM